MMLIFLPPILFGFGIALVKSRFNFKSLQIPRWKAGWLIFPALIIMLPATNPQIFHLQRIEDQWVAGLLGLSQLFVLAFVLLNIRFSGIWIVGFGFLLNMVCMQANGGFMPMQPEKLAYLTNNPDVVEGQYLGSRFGNSKDIILEQEQTILWQFDDRFTLPEEFPYRVVFSLGDIIIGVGLIFLLYRTTPGSFVHVGAPNEYKDREFRGHCPKRQTCE
jgi:hypothetical protein